MNLESLIGQTLDSKYLIERELGRGGMGAVYLSTHIGTERPVALKVIVPQFMERPEFVERFRREARAAGRLRHPNVVDVTDFGIANTSQGRVAYLVMEYLDGCTLGEILEEEQQLPLGWTLDILEQVCSAVHEAHGQGIIHRDLKPDNIWLEPNQRGGYTVKVLDFGIAKLEEPMGEDSGKPLLKPSTSIPTQAIQQGETFAEQRDAKTIVENRGATMIGEGGTLIQPNDNEKGTAIFPPSKVSLEKGTAIFPVAELSDEDGTAIFPNNKGTQLIEKDEGGTKLLSQAIDTDKVEIEATSELTRVGSVLGTPLYMSPEQCRGEKLTPHSDIYSLAVIAYQMLSGKTPFTGNFTEVMDSHKEIPPPPLDAKKIPKKVKKVLFEALAKDKEIRPPTAEAFASQLRSHSEGFAKLLQKALVIYSEHLPKFLLLALLLTLPQFFFSLLKVLFGVLGSTEVISTRAGFISSSVTSFIGFFVQIFSTAMLLGAVTWITTQLLAAPLKPVSLKKAIKVVWSKKRTLFPATLLQTFVVITCCFPLGPYLLPALMLVNPSIIMEDLGIKASFKRSVQLVHRSFLTAFAAAMMMFIIPAAIGGTIGGASAALAKQFEYYERVENGEVIQAKDKEGQDIDINVGPGGVQINDKTKENKELSDEERKARRLSGARRETISEIILGLFLTPIMILLTSLTSVITALMYFKTRQAGGESMQELLAKFEDAKHPQSK
ncbi:MAG: serine/threonine-protein kinase, partial [Acidobacteriota bacterium]